ncbi:MAG: CAP domain-containing protein, partial [Desulfobacterales bacterium]|nr:CAP domain-containing protein [Desulfobacterales bacterium]
ILVLLIFGDFGRKLVADDSFPDIVQKDVGSLQAFQSENIDQLTQDEQEMYFLVNYERQKIGLEPLAIDLQLVKLAREKAEDIIINNYFDHYSPTLGSPFEQMREAGIDYAHAGENLAGSPTALEAHEALLNSPGHRANILKDRYTHIGIGVFVDGSYSKMFVQQFIQAW